MPAGGGRLTFWPASSASISASISASLGSASAASSAAGAAGALAPAFLGSSAPASSAPASSAPASSASASAASAGLSWASTTRGACMTASDAKKKAQTRCGPKRDMGRTFNSFSDELVRVPQRTRAPRGLHLQRFGTAPLSARRPAREAGVKHRPSPIGGAAAWRGGCEEARV